MAISKRLRAEIIRRDKSTCQNCGAKAPGVALVVDHVIPVALGGSDDPSNLQTLCEPCNSGKSATPPDAATVARVSADARRWADAIQAAGEAMIGDLERQTGAHKEFDRAWLSWTEGRPAVPRPFGWETSIDAFLRAGLPLPVLLECIGIAMRARHVRTDDVFKYMCGVAWKEVKKLQKQASDRLESRPHQPLLESASADDSEESWAQVASELVELLTADECDRHEIDLERILTPEFDEEGERPLVNAFDAVLSDYRSDLHILASIIEDLLDLLPGGIGQHAQLIARHHLYRGPDEVQFMTRSRFAEVAGGWAGYLSRVIEATSYLEATPQGSDWWLRYAGNVHRAVGDGPWSEVPGDRKRIDAAHHARLSIERHLFHNAMCGFNRFDFCPELASHRVKVSGKECCTASSDDPDHGHHVCAEHYEQLSSGAHGDTTISDAKELDLP